MSSRTLEWLPPCAAGVQDIGAQKRYRKDAWMQTQQMGEAGGYTAPGTGEVVPLDFRGAVKGMQKFAGVTHPPPPLSDGDVREAEVTVVKGCCVETTARLAAEGRTPLLMDAGSRDHFGGGYRGGSRAQEEEICRRSTLPFAVDVALKAQTRQVYPLKPTDGVYVPDVTLFRDGYASGYRCLDTAQRCGVGIVAATYRPPVKNQRLGKKHAAEAEAMIRTFFEMARVNGHDTVVLVPVGCGAFHNPAAHVALIFAKIIHEYRTHVRHVVFSIFDDHNAAHADNPLGNFLPFALLAAGELGGRVYTSPSRDATVSLEELQAEAEQRLKSVSSA
eukprot:TRINITY_DN7309_c0_g1_i1.p1 TRINITY_DN7309_c0_g1~~TRINITY_DN7309_c0_g1_i1.p1  ORF type:complete len:332 (+),score=88.62 TRINITY_DN7309_c0_g1_i1:51-1046(+)